MPITDNGRPDPEDMFNDTRMSFGDHIEDLRAHLFRAIYGFSIGMVFSLIFLGQPAMRLIVGPVEAELEKFERRKLNRDYEETKAKLANLGQSLPPVLVKMRIPKARGPQPASMVLDTTVAGLEKILVDLDIHDWLDKETRDQGNFEEIEAQITDPMAFSKDVQQVLNKVSHKRLSTMHITEAFMVYFKLAMMAGLVLSSPWVFYQLWMFVAAGLYPHEKKLVNVYLPFSLFLFLFGVIFCQFMVIPRAIGAMLWFNEWLGIGADLRLNEWLGFALMMPLIFGVCFQTPLVMMFLHKVGILTVDHYRGYRRISWFVMAVIAAVFVPAVDVYSVVFLWLPMGLLYEFGILLCIWQGEHNTLLDSILGEEKNELVEV